MILFLYILTILITNGWGREPDYQEDTSPKPREECIVKQCFYKSEEFCPPSNGTCFCHRLPKCRKWIVCCNIPNDFKLTEGLACVARDGDHSSEYGEDALHIRNATLNELNLKNLTSRNWRNLKYMTITGGHIKHIVGEFNRKTPIKCLNFSSNGIVNFRNERALVNLEKLNVLDLSNNNLSTVPSFKMDGNVSLDISRNPYMICQSVNEALNRTNHILNENKTFCVYSSPQGWFNYTERMPLRELKVLIKKKQLCIPNCTCRALGVDITITTSKIIASLSVDCIGIGLTELPDKLPPNTVALNVTGNNITSLDKINHHLSYDSLRMFTADDNQITSISPLEGSKFITQFFYLSLKNNRLRILPTYILSIMFDRNYFSSKQVFLGGNRVVCDCNAAKILKVWLTTKHKQIPDYDEIYCENLDSTVISLDTSKLCQTQQDWTDYIYYIIAFQVFLLVSLIGKVSYDYWVFKTAGYLPWPANKMPKLPCDWLCE